MSKKYKYGISTTIDYTVDILDLLKFFEKTRFDFVSIGANLIHCHFLERSKFEHILRMAQERNLSVHSIHAPFNEEYDIASVDKSQRQKALSRMTDFLKRSADYEMPMVIIHPHYYFYDSMEDCYRRVEDSLKEILASKPRGIDIAVENLPGESSSLICEKILAAFNQSQLDFCYDSSHENISGEPFHLLREFHNRITVTHLSDNNGRFDEHLIPGDGNIDWTRLKAYFDESPIENLLFELGTGERLTEPVEDYIMRAASKIGEIFGY